MSLMLTDAESESDVEDSVNSRLRHIIERLQVLDFAHAGHMEPRLDALLRRLERALEALGDDDEPQRPRLDALLRRLQRALAKLEPLPPWKRAQIVKRFTHRPRRPGFAVGRKEVPVLELVTPGAGVTDVDSAALAVQCIISTGTRDRVGDVLPPEGCDITEYRTNPVVLWAHDAESFPIGKAEDPSGRCTVRIEPARNRVVAACYFIRGDELAEKCFDGISRRFLRGVSVGFEPDAEPEPLPGGGQLFPRWKLYEFSFVTIPANAEALVLAGGTEAC